MNHRFKKKQLLEFINKDGALINKSTPDYIDPKVSSKSTTDEFINATQQKRGLHAFFRAYGEADLPYNDVADQFQDNPEDFMLFLKTKGEEDQFGQYFQQKDGQESADSELMNPEKPEEQEPSKSQTPTSSVTPVKSAVYEEFVKEFTNKDKIISGKLDRILEYVNDNFTDDKKAAFFEYCINFKKFKVNG